MSRFPSIFILAYLLSDGTLRGHNCTLLSGWLLNGTTSRSFSWAVGRTGQARTDWWASCRQLKPHTAQNTRRFLLRAYGWLYWCWPWPLLPRLLLFLSLLLSHTKNHTHFYNTREQEDGSDNGDNHLQGERKRTRQMQWKRVRGKKSITLQNAPT